MKFPPAQEAKDRLQKILHKYIDPYKRDKTMYDKFIAAGHNVQFDVDFLSETWKKCGDKYFFGMIDYHKLDLVPLVQLLSIKGAIKPKSFKLVDVAKLFDITFTAHDAQEDIRTTREIVYKIINNLHYDKTGILGRKMIDADLGSGLE